MWYALYTHIHAMKYYLATKQNEILPFAATWMDMEIILSKVSQREKNKYHMILWNVKKKKKRYKWTYLQNRNRFTENEFMVGYQHGRGEGEIDWEFENDMYKPLYLK